MIHSLVIIVPNDLKAAANRVAWGLGWQGESGDTMNMRLEDESQNVFWGCRAQVSDPTVAAIQAAAGGTWINPVAGAWADYGVSAQDRADISAQMINDAIVYASDTDIAGHLISIAALHGLQVNTSAAI